MLKLTGFVDTVFTFGSFGPDTGTAVFIEVQTNSTLGFQSITINTVEEDIAYSFIGMSEESVLAWTEFAGNWFLCL